MAVYFWGEQDKCCFSLGSFTAKIKEEIEKSINSKKLTLMGNIISIIFKRIIRIDVIKVMLYVFFYVLFLLYCFLLAVVVIAVITV